MAYATIHNDGTGMQIVGGIQLFPQKTASLTQSEYMRMVEDHGEVIGLPNIVVTIEAAAGLASDVEVADAVAARVAVEGLLTSLTTTAKGSLVAAINELVARVVALETAP